MASETKDAAIREANRAVQEELIILASPEADRVRRLLDDAVDHGDFVAIHSEGYLWSGHIALRIFDLAEAVEATAK